MYMTALATSESDSSSINSDMPASISNLSIATIRAARSSRTTPRGSVSIASPGLDNHFATSATQDDPEVEDARRIFIEEDDPQLVRETLGRVISIADKLAAALSSMRAQNEKLEATNRVLQNAQTELETSLLLTKSNLSLERANNEMLEEALKREGGRDIGWKRWSEREGTTLMKRSQTPELARPTATRIQSTSALDLEEGRRSLSTDGSGGASANVSPTVGQGPPPPAVPAETNRFFKFRFGGASTLPSAKVSPTQPNQRSPTLPQMQPVIAAHLTSASLPSLLVGATTDSPAPSRPSTPPPTKEAIHSLRSELDAMKAQMELIQRDHVSLQVSHRKLESSHKTLAGEKKSLEEEIESLSQALFEEANKMVADERKARAAYEEELEVCKAEKEALKGALRVVEAENGQLRKNVDEVAVVEEDESPSPPVEEGSLSSRPETPSSLHGMKSEPSSPEARVRSQTPLEDPRPEKPRAPAEPRAYTPVYI